jgi:V/A-type H+-transporting ATPase subunit F
MEAKFGRIAVVGERDISLGFKLVGIKDVFISEGKDAASTISKLMSSKEYDLIIASYRLKALMSANARHLAETATKPLVIFIPSEKELAEQSESVESLAKRVLGVDIYKK